MKLEFMLEFDEKDTEELMEKISTNAEKFLDACGITDSRERKRFLNGVDYASGSLIELLKLKKVTLKVK